MKQQIKQVTKRLKIQFYLFWLLPVLIVVACETDLLNVGMYASDPGMRYMLETLGILITMICVPLSLKLFSIVLKKKINELAFPVAVRKYLFWSGIRLGILGLAALANVAVYYLTLSSVGGMCALIALTASVFCLPSEKRLYEELNIVIEND